MKQSLPREEVLRSFKELQKMADGFTLPGPRDDVARFSTPPGTNATASSLYPVRDQDTYHRPKEVCKELCRPKEVCIEQLLSAGRAHGECVLAGHVFKAWIYAGAAHFVLQDAAGDLIQVGVYNACESGQHPATLFPVGRLVSIADPHVTCDEADGQPYIRVDNPDCVQEFDFSQDVSGDSSWRR
jgi:hypothetical protein